jgi:crotonobetainyl-CoA:carnitine CoA-transferase CaiB-like acyl-CoA transferase
LLLRLVERADVFIESSNPGVMVGLDLDYERLRKVNPRLVYVSITAFGAEGPKAHYADSELIVWAAAGPLALCRTPDALPVRISVPQAYLHAASDAACGALIALLARAETGFGQHVEASAQVSSTLCTLFAHLAEAVGHRDYSVGAASSSMHKGHSKLDLSGSGSRTEKTKWLARDGLVELHVGLGSAGGRFANALFAWLSEIGACPDEFISWDWVTLPQRILDGEITLDQVERARDLVGEVLARYTRDELVAVAQARGFMLAPLLTTADLLDSAQLNARGFFVPVDEAGRLRALSAPFRSCGADIANLRPAPAIGEHNAEVFAELGLSRAALQNLTERKIV